MRYLRRARMSVNLSDASSNLSKPEPESPPKELQKKSKKASAADNTFALTLDASTNGIKVVLNSNSRIFGTNDPDSVHALIQQVYGFLSTAADKPDLDRKSTRLNSSHLGISYAVFCL